MTVYLWRVLGTNPPHYQVTKWEDEGNSQVPKETYTVLRNYCDCPAHVPFCKHLAMAKDCRDRGIDLSGLVFDDKHPTKFFRFMGSRGEFYCG